MTLIFGVWIFVSSVSSIGDVHNYYGTGKSGCGILYKDGSNVLVENISCYEVGKELKKHGL